MDATTEARKNLPGIDSAAEVYETTPDIPSSAPSSPISSAASTTSEEAEDSDYGVSRRRLYPSRARTKFSGQSPRRSFPSEPEPLSTKIARLKREVEECRVLAQTSEMQEKEEEDAIEALSKIMSGLDLPARHKRTSSAYHDAPTIPPPQTDGEQQQPPLPTIAAFDTRLASLESALGLSNLDPSTEISALTAPLLPTMALLDHQLATLSSATSLSALEAASTKIHTLKTEASDLASSEDTPFSPEDASSLNSLYALLPTLQSLSPVVPALTNRLRSLRTIHTAAATAHSDLDSIEQRQAEMDKELKMWREGLERVEEAVEEALEVNKRNGAFVKGWVEDLEGRVKGLKR